MEVAERRGGLLLGIPLLLLLIAAARGTWDEDKMTFLRGIAAKDAMATLDALEGIATHDRPEAASLLIEHGLTHQDLGVYRESERVLRSYTSPETQKVVIEAAKEERSWQLRADCVRVLAHYRTEESFEAMVELLSDKKWLVRSEAIRALGTVREKRAVRALLERLPEETGRMLDDLTDALRRLTRQDIPPDVRRWQSWWEAYGADWEMPPENPDEGNETRRLGTAVKQGLYGTVVSERVVFVIDISGSMTAGTDMEGSRHEIATRELVRVLENQVGPKSEFNVIAFSDEVYRYKPQLVKGRGSNLKKAIEFVEALRPGGETNAFGALERAFEDPEADTIYLLSDGSPTVGDETIPALIRQKVDEWNRYRGVKIHCIGFFPGDARHQDKAEARTFLVDLARENRGRYIEIE